ncbi:MAG: STAS domain-containing protein [Patescibacteria group bacterium]|nr:STAS domain-containing protein [Patescibacteria group bacterium]MDE2015730.1 STAS domain-containing protein [Patescibacteria group bacterium]MDE2226787.1 STAS domain-containing protein [Patescibacteria group bacterium]
MDFRTNIRKMDSITILDCSGTISMGKNIAENSAWMFDQTFKNLLRKGIKNLVVNLADVNYIDSTGVGYLVNAQRMFINKGGRLKLIHARKNIHDLLQITKLFSVLDTYDDEAAAVASF